MSKTRMLAVESKHSPRGSIFSGHSPGQDQLLFLARGALTLKEDSGTWVATPGRALYVPSRLPHALKLAPGSQLHAVLFSARERGGTNTSVRVTPLMRELVHAAGRLEPGRGAKEEARALEVLLRGEIARGSCETLHLPEPRGITLKRFCRTYAAAMDGRGKPPGSRVVERSFRREMGIVFRAWRIRVTLVRALELLGAGEPVANVSRKTGYASPSAFIFAFRRELGCAPGEYFGGEVRSN